MKNIKRKIGIMLMILMQIISLIAGYPSVKANIKEGDTLLLQGDHECDSLLEYWMEDYQRWSYKVVWYVYYIDKEEGKKYPAFCVQPEKEGVGTGYDAYNVTLNKEQDPIIWRILSKGYMGSKFQDWKLECDDDFYTATKVALHSYAQKISPKEKYIVGNRSVDGNTVEEIQRRGSKVLDVAQILYEYGISGKETYVEPKVNIKQQGEKKEEVIQGIEYVVQNYKVTGNKTLESYQISITNTIEGTKIFTQNNQEISSLTSPEFKIAIPTKNIKQDQKINIFIKEAKIKTNPIYHCKSSIEKAQNYVTYTAGWEVAQTNTSLSIEADQCNLELVKIDAQTKLPIKDVRFAIFSEKGEKIGEYTTNQEGKVILNGITPQVITIKEVYVDEKYEMNQEEKKVKLEWGKTAKVTIENKRKKGDLKLIKVDADNADIKLEKIEFDLIDEKGKVQAHLITDEKGEAFASNLDIGKYTLRETKTKEEYKITEDIPITIEWNKECTQVVENVKKKGQIEIKKVDKEDVKYPIQDVVFEVKNMDGKVVQTIITDENGIAITKELPVGEYKIQEIQTKEEYV